MMLLSCRQIKKSFAAEDVLKGVSFSIQHNEHIGLIGANGAGKSTLAAIIQGKISPDEGYLDFFGKPVSISFYNQDQAELENRVLGKTNLSGGEKAKASLAKALACQSSLLILDEPTNNLDAAGLSWLIREVRSYPGAVLIISHDRYFLDETVSRILFLEAGVLKNYEGNYSFFREEKRRQDHAQYHHYLTEQKAQREIQDQIKHLKNWSASAHRESREKQRQGEGKKEYFRAKAKKMDRQTKSKLKMLEKMQQKATEKPYCEQPIKLDFAEKAGHGRRILEAKEISKSYGRKQLFKEASFYVLRGEKVGIYGANGSGKTTLLKCLMGQEVLDQGNIWISPSAKWLYFQQDFLQLPMEQTPLQYLGENGEKRAEAVKVMAGLGLYGELLQEPIANLSLGERTRLKLGQILLQECNLLLLDEPTNHLDILSRELLEEALRQYQGTLLLVTHDRYLLNNVCNRMLVLTEGFLKRWETAADAGSTVKQSEEAQEIEQEKLRLELRLTWLLSQLSGLTSADPAYEALDQEFRDLSRLKRELGQGDGLHRFKKVDTVPYPLMS